MLILLISKLSSLPYFEDHQNVRRSTFQKSFVYDTTFPQEEISSSIERIGGFFPQESTSLLLL